MRWIYISPHLDDSALSAGGLIFDQTQSGIPVEIWTIVCGYPPPGELTPLAQVLHFQWGTTGPEETVALRREEDKAAAKVLGAKPVHFDVPDCIYRRGPDGEPLYMDIFVPPHPAEAALPDLIAQTISPHLLPDDQLVCQLGIGDHVDHILVRQAAEQLGRPLIYLADLPYLFNQPGELPLKTAGMKNTVHPVTEAGLEAWIAAVLAYRSQLSSLFERPEEVEALIHSFHDTWGGLPIWEIV